MPLLARSTRAPRALPLQSKCSHCPGNAAIADGPAEEVTNKLCVKNIVPPALDVMQGTMSGISESSNEFD